MKRKRSQNSRPPMARMPRQSPPNSAWKERYVRQRMKLATLAEPVKAAHREGKIDTAAAEAFATVPEDRQLEVWKEVNGNPRHAEHVRNVIANA
jgi:hypothetical protein